MIRCIGVVVPAANEEQLLPLCLAALMRSRARLARVRPDVVVHVVVVLDGCTDRSAEIVEQFPEIAAVTIDAHSAGAARRAGCDWLLEHLDDARDAWFASTDADSRVNPNWLSVMASAADSGADLVLGTVRPGQPLPAAIARSYDHAHTHSDGHRHVHGANLGVRASTYLAAGGWPDCTTGEDVLLATRVIATGARVVRTGRSPVRTSARLVGRAPHGYAAYLRSLLAEADPAGASAGASEAV